MPLPPGHYNEIEAQAKAYHKGFRGPRHRIVIGLGAACSILLIAAVLFSLTTTQKTSGRGCIDINYTTPIGGAETYKCGAEARALCAQASHSVALTAGVTTALETACRKAGLPTG